MGEMQHSLIFFQIF